MDDTSNYQKIRADAGQFYQRLGRIRCSALNNEPVHFTAEGFNHLIYKASRKERSRVDQITKFKLLPKAKVIIARATTYQEYDESITSVRKKRHHRVVYESAPVRYWGFVAIIDGTRLKVIVRQVGNGQKHFWSVIPAWRTSYYRDIKIIEKATGNLSED